MTDRRLFHVPLFAAAALIAAAAWVTPATAQSSDQEAAQACTPDVFRLCNEFVPDRARITACLFKKRLQLSPACKRFIKPHGKPRRHYRRRH